jgi:hypothetical protein
MQQPLPLSLLCAVVVNVVSSQGVSTPTFNQALVNGNSGRIPSQGPNSRCIEFASAAAMTAYGFQPLDPEFLAAALYFDAEETPTAPLWVGCQDTTAIAGLALVAGEGGTGWAVNDTFLVTQGAAAGGQGFVTAENAGVVTAVAFLSGQQGSGYAVAAGLSTAAQGASVGQGLQVSVTAIGETPLQAITACRLACTSWYLAMSCTATDADHLAITAYAQATVPAMQYVYGTQSASAMSGAVGNIFSLIKTAGFSRGHGAYSTVQGGAAPSNAYIAAAIAGEAMGLNTGLAGSNFTLAGKTLVGIIPENSSAGTLTLSQMNTFAGLPGTGTGNNGNCYMNYGNAYNNYEQGVNGNGTWFDQVLGLDMLAADAQISVLNAVKALKSVPQDNAGQTMVMNAATGACARSATRGFLATGVWSGPTILGLTAGTSVPGGFMVLSPQFSSQSQADRDLRKGLPIYIAVILAGSQQSFIIGISVQQ